MRKANRRNFLLTSRLRRCITTQVYSSVICLTLFWMITCDLYFFCCCCSSSFHLSTELSSSALVYNIADTQQPNKNCTNMFLMCCHFINGTAMNEFRKILRGVMALLLCSALVQMKLTRNKQSEAIKYSERMKIWWKREMKREKTGKLSINSVK